MNDQYSNYKGNGYIRSEIYKFYLFWIVIMFVHTSFVINKKWNAATQNIGGVFMCIVGNSSNDC